jgi:hypothetical protein
MSVRVAERSGRLNRHHPSGGRLVQPGVIPSPKTGRQLVDEYFIENRTRLLEIAAFLDRLDRTDSALPDHDFRVRAFREALSLLDQPPAASTGPATRVERIQHLLSDPTTEPLERLDMKSARGAYDRWQLGVA